MGWTATDYEGRKMWEDGSGQRIYDPADIPGNRPPERNPFDEGPLLGPGGAGFVLGLIVGLTIAVLIYG